MSKRIKVVKGDPPETKEVLAEAIIRIGRAMKALEKSGLNEKAIVVLIHHETKVSMGNIRTVLHALRQLESWYTR